MEQAKADLHFRKRLIAALRSPSNPLGRCPARYLCVFFNTPNCFKLSS
jgi:hypothetical protein